MAKKNGAATMMYRKVTGTPERVSGGGWRVRGKVSQLAMNDGEPRPLTEFGALPYLQVEEFGDNVFENLAPDTVMTYEERFTTLFSSSGTPEAYGKSYMLAIKRSKTDK